MRRPGRAGHRGPEAGQPQVALAFSGLVHHEEPNDAMYWYPCTCGLVHAEGDAPTAPPHRCPPVTPSGLWGAGPPSTLDLELISLIYGPIAGAATCSACGAPLGRRLRVMPSPTFGTPPLWRVSVVTQCDGWRRHGHVANVSQSSGDLALGALRPIVPTRAPNSRPGG